MIVKQASKEATFSWLMIMIVIPVIAIAIIMITTTTSITTTTIMITTIKPRKLPSPGSCKTPQAFPLGGHQP